MGCWARIREEGTPDRIWRCLDVAYSKGTTCQTLSSVGPCGNCGLVIVFQVQLGSWRASCAINDSPLDLNLGARGSGVRIGPHHDPDGMLSRSQATDMPIVVVCRVFGDPGIDFADLFAIKENVGAAAFLGAAADDGNARALERESRLSASRPCLIEAQLAAPGQLA